MSWDTITADLEAKATAVVVRLTVATDEDRIQWEDSNDFKNNGYCYRGVRLVNLGQLVFSTYLQFQAGDPFTGLLFSTAELVGLWAAIKNQRRRMAEKAIDSILEELG
jgi:hypothetical protein